MNYSIRTAQETDALAMVNLLIPIIEAGHTIMPSASLEEQLDFLRTFPERGIFHVAVNDDTQEILGMQDILPMSDEAAFRHVGEISSFVAVAAQGHGIGRSLSQASFEAAKAKGYEKLTATIRGDNPRAIAFYLSQGFRLVGTFQNHALVNRKYIDEVVTEKFLIPAT